MTDTPLDLAAIDLDSLLESADYVVRCAGEAPAHAAMICDLLPALVAALRKAEAQRDEQARFKEAQRADKRKARALLSEWRMRGMRAEAQVAAVLALCDEAAPRRMGDGYLSASVLAPEDVRAAVDGAS